MEGGHASGGSRTEGEVRVGHVDLGRTWDDLVLPEELRERLRSVSDQLRQRVSARPSETSVVREPAAPVLFLGADGTGKTTAAQIIAADLGLPLHELDLAPALSHPGTDLARTVAPAFESAESEGALLVIDGAGPLLRQPPPAEWHGSDSSRLAPLAGDGGPAADSEHDAFDGSLTALLERAARHDGVVIFTSTVTHGIDPALAERFDPVINFPTPETEDRREIWRRSLPADAQLTPSNLYYLASWLKWSGGTIERCSAAAAEEAASQGVPLQLSHVATVLDQGYHGRRRRRRAAAATPVFPKPPAESGARAAPTVPAPSAPASRADTEAPPTAAEPAPPPDIEAPAPPASGSDPPTETEEPGQTLPWLGRPGVRRAEPWDEAAPVAAEPVRTSSGGLRFRYRGRPRAAESPPPASAPASPPPASAPASPPPASAPASPPTPGPAPSPHVRRRWPVVALGVVIAAAVIGAIIALTSAGAPSASGTTAASVDAVRVSLPSTWHREAPSASPSLGLTGELAVAAPAPSRGVLVIGRMAPSSQSALPQSLLATLPSTVTPQIVKMDRVVFYRYPSSPARGAGASQSIYAMPTTAGTVIGVCRPVATSSAFAGDCERVLGTLRLASGQAIPLILSATYARTVNSVITRLNSVRSSAGRQLAAATTAHAQATAATLLQKADSQAASSLAHLSTGGASVANTALAHALLVTADAYGALAHAAAHNDSHGYSAARVDLARSNQALSLAFGQLRALGYQVG